MRKLLEGIDDVQIVGEAPNRNQCVEMLAKLKPDILLLDVRMPEKDGLSVLEEVNFDSLSTRVIVLTAAEDDRDMLIGAMRLGAHGVVLKQSASDLLLKSIRKVHDGEIWLDNRITAEVIDWASCAHVGSPCSSSASVTTRACVPSDCITYKSVRPFWWTENAIYRPSGEIAGPPKIRAP